MMKRILFAIMAFCLVNISAMAGLDISVTKGDKKFFKTSEGNAVLEIVWDGATYSKSESLSAHFDNFDELKKRAEASFTETFNKKCKKVKIADKAADTMYKLTLKVADMDQYVNVMGFIPGKATKIWDTITVSNVQTGEELVVIAVDEVDGGGNPSPDNSFADCFKELAVQVCKLK